MDKAFKAKKMGQNSDFTTLSQEVNHIHGFSNSLLVDELSKLLKILLLAEEMNNSNVYRNEAYEHGRKRRK